MSSMLPRSLMTQLLVLIGVFVCIVSWRQTSTANPSQIQILPEAPSTMSRQLLAASDQAFSYRLALLWLQQFDAQSGRYISFRQLDYKKLVRWLDWLQQLAPESQYPMLLAARIYTKVADDQRRRIMLDFIEQQYLQNPEKNWRWMAEATITARHVLKDLPLALRYASELAESEDENVPYWVRDMRLTILEDMGEYEQVQLLVGGLLANKAISDENELRFLNTLLKRLQKNND